MRRDIFELLLTEAIETGMDPERVKYALGLVARLKEVKMQTAQMEEELSGLGDELCAAASVKMRSKLDRVESRINKNGCTFNYKARSLVIKPDFENNVWTVSPGPSKHDRDMLAKIDKNSLTVPLEKLNELVELIAEIFYNKYTTLRSGKYKPERPSPEEDSVPDEDIDAALEETGASGATEQPVTPTPDAPPPTINNPKVGKPPYA